MIVYSANQVFQLADIKSVMDQMNFWKTLHNVQIHVSQQHIIFMNNYFPFIARERRSYKGT